MSPRKVLRRLSRGIVWTVCTLAPLGVHADLVIPTSSVVTLGSGAIDLAGTDLVIRGTLNLDSGALMNVRNVVVEAGGIFNADQGTIGLAGSWSNTGSFNPGTSTVWFTDGLGNSSSSVSGSSAFYDVRFNSATGKLYVFESGSIQTVAHLLEVNGIPGLPIQFASSSPGQLAYLNLQLGGNQSISAVSVMDIAATGQALAPNQSNSGGGNAPNWFGASAPATTTMPIPTLNPMAIIALIALIGLSVARRAHGRGRPVARTGKNT